MRTGHVLFSLALGLLLASATPLKGPAKSLSLTLHRRFPLFESEDAHQLLPLSVNDMESLVYTVDVQVESQRFNLTLDTSAQASVLFAKGFAASDRSCSTGDAQRHLFDPSLSKSFNVTYGDVAGDGWWFHLSDYPYVGIECLQIYGSNMFLGGVYAQDTYQLGALSVPAVAFILANRTFPQPLNARWASDGVFPLRWKYGEAQALETVLDAFGGSHEVSLFLNNAKPSDNHPAPGGRITFGSKNEQDCGDKWITLQVDHSKWPTWGLPLNNVTLGTHSIGSSEYTELSTSTPFLVVGSDFFRTLMNVLGGTFNEDLDLYTVDCGKVGSLPPITMNIGSGFGLAYDVTAKDYVTKVNGKNGAQCALLIVKSGVEWMVGTQFLPKRCVHLDYAYQQIGFADPKN